VALPILDDPVLHITVPQYRYNLFNVFMITAYWFVSIFAGLGLVVTLFLRSDVLSKPIRQDVRQTALRKPSNMKSLTASV